MDLLMARNGAEQMLDEFFTGSIASDDFLALLPRKLKDDAGVLPRNPDSTHPNINRT
jgi:hypothetical protein